MTKRLMLVLLALSVLAAGCDGLRSEGEECPPDAACMDSTVPDVEHRELRKAYRQLEGAGFQPRLSPKLEAEGYADYVEDERMGIHPEPWVGDIDPEPGEKASDGLVVTITEIECPHRKPTCD